MSVFNKLIFLALLACAFGIKSRNDDSYNPCDAESGVFFYPDPLDVRQYYQCDESDKAYLRSCGNLHWDNMLKACNWAWLVVVPPATTPAVTVIKPTLPNIFIEPATFPPLPPLPSTTTTTTTPFTPSPIIIGASLCRPNNPCGIHGQCIESPSSIPLESRQFACICDEDWFGRLCDKRIDDFAEKTSLQQRVKRDSHMVPSGPVKKPTTASLTEPSKKPNKLSRRPGKKPKKPVDEIEKPKKNSRKPKKPKKPARGPKKPVQVSKKPNKFVQSV